MKEASEARIGYQWLSTSGSFGFRMEIILYRYCAKEMGDRACFACVDVSPTWRFQFYDMKSLTGQHILACITMLGQGGLAE